MKWFLALLIFLPFMAQAGEPELRGEYKNWTVYRYQEADGPVCYAMVRANKKKDAKDDGRGQVILQIAKRPRENGNMVVSYVAGHRMKSKSNVNALSDKGDFLLRADGDTAWTPKPTDDAAALGVIRAGNWLVVKHQDTKGKVLKDEFSLSGSTAAIDAVNQCQ